MQHLLCTVLYTKYSLGTISSLPHRHPSWWMILSRAFLAPHLMPPRLPNGGGPGKVLHPSYPDPDPDPLGWAAAPKPSWEPHPDFSLACTVCLVSRLFAPTAHSIDAHLGLVSTSGPAAVTIGQGCPESFTAGPLQEGGLFLHTMWFPL